MIPTTEVSMPKGFHPEEEEVNDVIDDINEYTRVGLCPPDNDGDLKSLEFDVYQL